MRLLRGPATRRAMRLFGGSCGLTPRRRCQPGSGATRSEPVFPTKREGPARGCRRHAVMVEALAPPDAARVVIRVAIRVATVYTNAPKRRRGAISTDLCTLLRPHGRSHDPRETQQCTQMPQSGAEGAISIDLCTLLRRRPGGEAHAVGAVTQPPTHTNSRSLSNEVDFVVGWGEDVIGIEVKSGRVRSTGGLTAFLLRFPGARTLVIGSPTCTVGSFLLGAWPLLGLSTSRGPPPSLCGCSTGSSLEARVS